MQKSHLGSFEIIQPLRGRNCSVIKYRPSNLTNEEMNIPPDSESEDVF